MQQAHYGPHRVQTKHCAQLWMSGSASHLTTGLNVASQTLCNSGHGFPSCVQTKYSAVHLRSGFTLVELIVTISILAIIAVMAAPSFAAMYSRQKLESSAHELVMKISEARSQAVVLRQTTGLCLASLSEEDCATALSIPKTETQRIFIARLDNGVTPANTSSQSLSFRRNGSLATQKDFILERQNLSYCIRVGVIGDTTVTEGVCT